MSPFVRRVKTASGATAVQIVEKRNGRRRVLEHVGSAHDETELAVLVSAAQQRLYGIQDDMLQFEPVHRDPVGPVVEHTSSQLLWRVLTGAYHTLGFDQIRDEAFASLVTARIVEPTSKLDTIRVLDELGQAAPHPNTLYNCLRRCVQRDYRSRIATACWAHACAGGPVGLVMYDLTTLYFEAENEDSLRKVGMSKERRVDPQVTVGLLTDTSGFPLAVHLFEGNKAETRTLIPVLTAFRDRHHGAELIVVADAGMLSAANLLALETAGFGFIVGSRAARTPYDLADHLKTKGNNFADGQVIETTRDMGVGKNKRTRRVVYQYRFKRSQHDNRAINAMIARAEDVAAGTRPLKKDRFVKIDGATKGVDWDLVERARSLTGVKGYVTSIDTATMDGAAVIAAYTDLYQVERSFRMTKSDLAARPVFHRLKDSIEAHLTIVFAALAVSREAQTRTGLSIKKIITTLRPLRSATIMIGHQRLTAEPRVPTQTQPILDALTQSAH